MTAKENCQRVGTRLLCHIAGPSDLGWPVEREKPEAMCDAMQVCRQFMDRFAAGHIVNMGGEPCVHQLVCHCIDESDRSRHSFRVIADQRCVIIMQVSAANTAEVLIIVPVLGWQVGDGLYLYGVNRQELGDIIGDLLRHLGCIAGSRGEEVFGGCDQLPRVDPFRTKDLLRPVETVDDPVFQIIADTGLPAPKHPFRSPFLAV